MSSGHTCSWEAWTSSFPRSSPYIRQSIAIAVVWSSSFSMGLHTMQSSVGFVHKVTTRNHAWGHRTQSILIYGFVGLWTLDGFHLALASVQALMLQACDGVAMLMPSSVLHSRVLENEACLDLFGRRCDEYSRFWKSICRVAARSASTSTDVTQQYCLRHPSCMCIQEGKA